MRDYKFGNFINNLREQQGLSQYQLGTLVGVSDKAVSKWENGITKPRLDTMKKLSYVLNVSLYELVSGEYIGLKKSQKNIKKEIFDIAQQNLIDIYGNNPPLIITNLFKTEKMMLNEQDIILWMGFLGELKKELNSKKIYIENRCAQVEASFIAWLLGGTDVNPLKPHYYCPKCKNIEFVTDVKCGLDLPDKNCSCGNRYYKDGFGIDAINMYPYPKGIEVHTSHEGASIAEEFLQKYFAYSYEINEFAPSYFTEGVGYTSGESVVKWFGLMPIRENENFAKNINSYKPKMKSKLSKEHLTITILANEKYENISIEPNREYTSQLLKEYIDYIISTNKYDDTYNKMLTEIERPHFSDLIAAFGLEHSAGVWVNNGDELYEAGVSHMDMIALREDVYDYLYKILNTKYDENLSGLIFEIKESLRMGIYFSKCIPTETEQFLSDSGVPSWYIASMKKIMYLIPKTHAIISLKRDLTRFESLIDR